MDRIFKSIFIALVVLIVLVTFHYLGWLKIADNAMVRVLSPVQEGVYAVTIGFRSFYHDWFIRKDLLQENNELKNKLVSAKIDQAYLNSLIEENNLLKKELNFIETSELNFVAAKIITGVADDFSQSVVINRGSRHGLMKGLAVAAADGILIGKISEVQADFSKVLLLNDNQSRVAATIQNRHQTIGLVEGQFGLGFLMTNIPQDELLTEGDLVVTSGLEGQIPKNILIAEVESVNQVESEIFKSAILKPIISFDNLSYVLVIIP